MSARNLSQDELVKAFNKILPKRPTYPPLVPDDDVLSNSATDSEDSDEEQEELDERKVVSVNFTAVISPDYRVALNTTGCKPPDVYLKDNIKKDLEIALSKLANLKIKPKNPIEWLGYCLMNMNIKDPRPPSKDQKEIPTGAALGCSVTVDLQAKPFWQACRDTLFHTPESGPILGRASSNGKRKMSDE